VIRLDYLTAPSKVAKEAGRNIGGIKSSKTLSLPISIWALTEQVRSLKGFKNANEAFCFCVMNTSQDLGLETG